MRYLCLHLITGVELFSVCDMDKTLDTLFGKIEQVVMLADSLRGEKVLLETRLRQVEEERDWLKKNVAQVRERIEHLVSQLPEQTT
ncbi:MAG: hypothetical protein FWH15_05540 [Betaproteobacteria bacterium]|nr:hypothetical protein [Betaproteobacteria bacterium]